MIGLFPAFIHEGKVKERQKPVMIVTEGVEVKSGVYRDPVAVEKGGDRRHALTVVAVDKE
jgi:hypothetical protein